jgi:hypothetical protein
VLTESGGTVGNCTGIVRLVRDPDRDQISTAQRRALPRRRYHQAVNAHAGQLAMQVRTTWWCRRPGRTEVGLTDGTTAFPPRCTHLTNRNV